MEKSTKTKIELFDFLNDGNISYNTAVWYYYLGRDKLNLYFYKDKKKCIKSKLNLTLNSFKNLSSQTKIEYLRISKSVNSLSYRSINNTLKEIKNSLFPEEHQKILDAIKYKIILNIKEDAKLTKYDEKEWLIRSEKNLKESEKLLRVFSSNKIKV